MVSHLLFSDYCFLFFRANEKKVREMKNILNLYAEKLIFLNWWSILTGILFPLRHVTCYLLSWGFSVTMSTGRYLGLPSTVGRNKKSLFGFIKDKEWMRMNSWSSKAL